jgi:hypothetical protein
MLVVAKKNIEYAKVPYRIGDQFEASVRDASILIALGAASQVLEPVPEVRKRQYRRRDMQAKG